MHYILEDVIPLFERNYSVRVHYSHNPIDMSYDIRMRLDDRYIMYRISDHSMSTHGELHELLLYLYDQLLHQDIKPEPEPEKPKDTPPPTNCPNCGAVVTSRQCEYCGTIHWGFEEKEEEEYSSFGVSMEEAVANINAFTRAAVMTHDEVREVMGLNIHHTGTVAAFNSPENAKAYAEKERARLVRENEELAAKAVRHYAETLFLKTEQPKKEKKKLFKRRKK